MLFQIATILVVTLSGVIDFLKGCQIALNLKFLEGSIQGRDNLVDNKTNTVGKVKKSLQVPVNSLFYR
jgi:hypothetical protein